MKNPVDRINIRTMHAADAVRHYSHSQALTPAEQASVDSVKAQARGQPILDLGVGAGRTVKPLLEISTDYLGIDNSHAMVAAARQRHPGVRLEYADARDLRLLQDGTIYLAMFSCNGIGMVAHEDRLAIMREVFRVLRPGGVFLFSTHNRNCPDHSAGFRWPSFSMSKNLAKVAVRAARFAVASGRRAANRYRFRPHELRTPEYSVINDVCHDYGTMLYYITLTAQRQQLVQLGFAADAVAFDSRGRQIAGDSVESSMAFVAHKPG